MTNSISEIEKDLIGIIILAAGRGKRMKSNKAKVLHQLNNKPMIYYVVDLAKKISQNNIIIVVGHQADKVKNEVNSKYRNIIYANQYKQLGTGHAVNCALPLLTKNIEHVVILSGDVPNIKYPTIYNLIKTQINGKYHLSIISTKIDKPTGYGRVFLDGNNQVTKIVEELDLEKAQKEQKIINTGIYCVEKKFLNEAIHNLNTANAQNEYYLTDIVKYANIQRLKIGCLFHEESHELLGVNTKQQLLDLEKIMER